MVYYSKRKYTFKTIRKSSNPKKKYETILENKKTGKQVIMRWGSPSYEQYQDKTPLKLYAHKDHKNKVRRDAYRARHRVYIRQGYYSPGQQSWKWLW